MREKSKKEWERLAKEGNTFAKAMVESWEKEKKQQPEGAKGDWFEVLIGIAGGITIFVIFGVIILGIIKWAFTTVF